MALNHFLIFEHHAKSVSRDWLGATLTRWMVVMVVVVGAVTLQGDRLV